MKRIYRRRIVQPYVRALLVIAAVSILVTGVTFAALQSNQAALSGGTIQTASADLKISVDGSNFGTSKSGFIFNEIIPGSSTVEPGNAFYLKNTGSTTLGIKMAINSTPVNSSEVDLNKVFVLLTPQGAAAQKISISALMSAYVSGGTSLLSNIASGATNQYTMQIVMDGDAYSGQEATITGVDFVFSGNSLSE